MSTREVVVLELLLENRMNREIALQLGFSAKSVETYVRRLLAKFGLERRAEVASLTIAREWVRPKGPEGT